ncbi:ADL217Wp [Eremothecium gossypii ATCC 10895]|uniref:non-specific serine/threonine protein kinase n=1 Tax=Eremothecium gossypii (strain ATCC 10895 / CBS 109.51 / FGSC 9923 / NRRL Y-1056) TaxID=284811 RepID=Q75AY7_EREGS|nr:ADL217Wp [Eremothecium gossypii ATCC 10895]AAS51703.2 ADL217Wp [Eremothecium gossypii ATCC 10895]
MNQVPQDCLQPGIILTVGSHEVKIIQYLTSGGFAQIYSCEVLSPGPIQGSLACLKRVHVPDKPSLNTLRAEVDAMKMLKGHRHVVSYIDSHAAKSPRHDGTYEVYLLMEYCLRGGLIDFMNSRLQTRLSEFEVLKIMSHVAQGIMAMHALVPPLIHRDIKIENVLISGDGDFKVCDFGSVSGVIRPPKNAYEFNYVQHDILKNTTAQYRAPEMIDLYRALPVDEKSDIWALGVFLYKVCYFTTPFEKVGENAILQAKFQFPSYPQYTDRLKNLISVMLSEHPVQRPNICQVLEEVSRIQGVPCPLPNFYLERMKHGACTPVHHSASQPALPLATHQFSTSTPMVTHPQPPANQMSPLPHGIQPITSNMVYMMHNTTPNIKDIPRENPAATIQKNALYSMSGSEHLSALSSDMHFNRPQLENSHTFSGVGPRSSSNPIKIPRNEIQKFLSGTPPTSAKKPTYVDSETQTGDIITSNKSGSRPFAMSLSPLSSPELFSEQSTGNSLLGRLSRKTIRSPTSDKGSNPLKSKSSVGDDLASLLSSPSRNLSFPAQSSKSSKRNSADLSSRKSPVLNKSRIAMSYSGPEKSSATGLESSSSSLFGSQNGEHRPPSSTDRHKSNSTSFRLVPTKKGQTSIQERVHKLLATSAQEDVSKKASKKTTNSATSAKLEHQKGDEQSISTGSMSKIDAISMDLSSIAAGNVSKSQFTSVENVLKAAANGSVTAGKKPTTSETSKSAVSASATNTRKAPNSSENATKLPNVVSPTKRANTVETPQRSPADPVSAKVASSMDSKTKDKKQPPTKPPKPAHLRPKLPPKPSHLKSPSVDKKRMSKDASTLISEC